MNNFFRMKIDEIRSQAYIFGNCNEILGIGKKASEAFQKAQELYLSQRQTIKPGNEIDMNTLRYPANNPGLFGAISSNLLVIELLLNADDLKNVQLKNEFLEHLVEPNSTRDISLMFQNIGWSWLEYLDYISGLIKRTQECFLTITRKFAYTPQGRNTTAAFQNLARDFDRVLCGFSVENWRKHLDRLSNQKEKLRFLRRNFTIGLLHSFGRLLICDLARIKKYVKSSSSFLSNVINYKYIWFDN